MRGRRLILLGTVIALILLGLVAFQFNLVPSPLQAPQVIFVDPVSGALDVPPGSPIVLAFTTAMDKTATQNAVSLSPDVTGTYQWLDDRTLAFTPDARLPISSTVSINLNQNARSWLYRPLQGQSSASFTTISRPLVTQSNPALDAKFTYIPNTLTITFNRPMEANTLYESLLIEPPPENPVYHLDGNTFTIQGYFAPRTQYKITIPAFAFDAEYGIELNRDYVWSFYSATQYPNVSIIDSARLLKYPADQPIELPMQFTNTSRLNFTLYPIPPETLQYLADAPFETWYNFQPATAPLPTISLPTNAQLDQYTLQTLTLAPPPPGTYYLKISSPEKAEEFRLLSVQ